MARRRPHIKSEKTAPTETNAAYRCRRTPHFWCPGADNLMNRRWLSYSKLAE
jgi:hypothetical protein